MLQDMVRMGWGSHPQQLPGVYLAYGQLRFDTVRIPVWNGLVLAAALAVAAGLGAFLQGRFSAGCCAPRRRTGAWRPRSAWIRGGSTPWCSRSARRWAASAGALVVPSAAATPEMAAELVVEAFAVVVIGGLGSMPGALAGAAIVGVLRAGALLVWPELELLAIYAVVVAVLLLRPAGLFGKPAT